MDRKVAARPLGGSGVRTLCVSPGVDARLEARVAGLEGQRHAQMLDRPGQVADPGLGFGLDMKLSALIGGAADLGSPLLDVAAAGLGQLDPQAAPLLIALGVVGASTASVAKHAIGFRHALRDTSTMVTEFGVEVAVGVGVKIAGRGVVSATDFGGGGRGFDVEQFVVVELLIPPRVDLAFPARFDLHVAVARDET